MLEQNRDGQPKRGSTPSEITKWRGRYVPPKPGPETKCVQSNDVPIPGRSRPICPLTLQQYLPEYNHWRTRR